MKTAPICFFVTVIAIFLIIIIYITKGATNSCNKYHYYLTGMWSGDPEFLKKSNLQDLKLFISPRERGVRNCYIIMVDINGGFILNEPISMKEISSSHNQRWNSHSENKKIKNDSFNVEFALLGEEKKTFSSEVFNVFPNRFILSFSIMGGSLIIKNREGKIYALFEKDLLSSAAAINAYEKKK